MNKMDFQEAISKLHEYYNIAREPSAGQMRQWYEKVKDIPIEALSFIHNRITSNSDTLPRNIPKHMLAYWFDWKNVNADKIMRYPKTDCDECGGHGFLWARRPAMIDGKQLTAFYGPVMEEVSYRCNQCENWRNDVHEKAKPAATRQWILDQGWEFVDPKGNSEYYQNRPRVDPAKLFTSISDKAIYERREKRRRILEEQALKIKQEAKHGQTG